MLQGASSGLVVNSHALPGKVPEKLDIDVEGDVVPAHWLLSTLPSTLTMSTQ